MADHAAELANALQTIRIICDAVDDWPEGKEYAETERDLVEALSVAASELRIRAQTDEPIVELSVLVARAADWLAYSGGTVTVKCDQCSAKFERERLPHDHHDDERRPAELCDRCDGSFRSAAKRDRTDRESGTGDYTPAGDEPKTDMMRRAQAVRP